MGVFEKKSGKFKKSQVSLTKFEKISDFVSSNKNFLEFQKPSNYKKLIKSPLKSD